MENTNGQTRGGQTDVVPENGLTAPGLTETGI